MRHWQLDAQMRRTCEHVSNGYFGHHRYAAANDMLLSQHRFRLRMFGMVSPALAQHMCRWVSRKFRWIALKRSVDLLLPAEAQLDFHSKRLNEISIFMASKPDANTAPPPSTTALIITTTKTPAIIWTAPPSTTTHLTPILQAVTTDGVVTSTKATKTIHHSRISKNPRLNWRQKFLIATTTANILTHTTSTQPTNLVKNEPQTSENAVQKVLDYNSISDDEKNESAVDMMLRKSTTTTTEQTTTPEPRN